MSFWVYDVTITAYRSYIVYNHLIIINCHHDDFMYSLKKHVLMCQSGLYDFDFGPQKVASVYMRALKLGLNIYIKKKTIGAQKYSK